ncbi:uncharacterized protein N7496_005679 [Penicillium cataractarum]|uniref:Uncharacterized protein n=1 Tax=Penicillium cataractarum TaxID=2100454 RepID=A0A9W9SHU5_9EURO|nr:uncharacterized protein N7496_005679 [Penicillium cataractarum]KAJ5378270.1 hypothetical protein N7496_005679 [Penicillium cataractarum]
MASYTTGDSGMTRQSFMASKLSLKNKVTVVTGGSRGIGLDLAESTADLGSDVVLMDIREPQTDLKELATKYKTRFKFYHTDVTEMTSLQASFDRCVNDLGKIDNCITAAGVAMDKPFLDHTWDECRKLLDVNVLGSFFCAQLAARQMKEQQTGGSIVMIASIAAHCAIPAQRVSMYGGTKAAIKLLGQTLGAELAPLNIRVNTVSPGFIATDMSKQFTELQDVFRNVPPLGRIGETGDLAMAVAYFLCSGSSYTTGADLAVTGGLHNGRIEL